MTDKELDKMIEKLKSGPVQVIKNKIKFINEHLEDIQNILNKYNLKANIEAFKSLNDENYLRIEIFQINEE